MSKINKICYGCNEEKSISCFVKKENLCKACKSQYNKKYREVHKEHLKKLNKEYYQKHGDILRNNQKIYYENNTLSILEYKKHYRVLNAEKISEYDKMYFANNEEKLLGYKKQYYLLHKEEINKNKVLYIKNREVSDPEFKIKRLVSSSIRTSLKRKNIPKNKENLVSAFGKNYARNLKHHIESQFEYWMSWENLGVYSSTTWNDADCSTWTWQIDHIIPHSNFKYTSVDDIECREAWALGNLRPLSAKHNIIDGARILDIEVYNYIMKNIKRELDL